MLLKRGRELLGVKEEYMEKHIGLETSFIPEVYDDGYLIGHTSNYLMIKAKGDRELLGKEVIVKISKVEYPYLLSNIKIFELNK